MMMKMVMMNNKASYIQVLVFSIMIFGCTRQKEIVEEKEEYDIIHSMSQLQRFSQKVYFAGEVENWELAGFYAHELEEVVEDLADNKVVHDGYDISNFAENILESSIKELDKSVKAKDLTSFLKNYDVMIQSCNTCHQATHHSFIKIIRPTNPDIFNQEFIKD